MIESPEPTLFHTPSTFTFFRNVFKLFFLARRKYIIFSDKEKHTQNHDGSPYGDHGGWNVVHDQDLDHQGDDYFRRVGHGDDGGHGHGAREVAEESGQEEEETACNVTCISHIGCHTEPNKAFHMTEA